MPATSVTSPLSINVRKICKRDRSVSEIIEGSRVIYPAEEPASCTNPPKVTRDETELDREAGLHREFALRVASPSEGVPYEVWGVPRSRILKTSSAYVNKPSTNSSHSKISKGKCMLSPGMLSPASPPTLSGLNGENAQGDAFWDGDPSTQSFIQFVGLSSPSHPASRTCVARSRPASAPSRRSWAKASTSAGYISPRQIRTANWGDHAGRTNHLKNIQRFPNASDDNVGRQSCFSNQVTHAIDQRRAEGMGEGMMTVLERRVEVLARENARLRDAMLDSKKKACINRLGRMALSQRRSLEVIAALQSAKERADNRARRIQDRLRTVQNNLRREMVQESATVAVANDAQRGHDLSANDLIEADVKRNLADAHGKIYSGPKNGHTTRDGRAHTLVTAPNHIKTVKHKCRGNDSMQTATARSSIEPTGRTAGENKQKKVRPTAKAIERPQQPLGNCSEDGIAAPSSGAKGEVACGDMPLFCSGGGSGNGGVGAAEAGRASAQKAHRRSIVERSLDTARHRYRMKEEEKKRKEEEEEELERTMRGKRESPSKAAGGDDSISRRIAGYHHNGGGSGDAAPRVLLQREAEAARKRDERKQRAKEKEEDELQLSTSFRATELHATSGPDWATIKAQQDLVRKQRVRERAAHLVATSSLPPRMARHAAMQAVEEDHECSKAGKGRAPASTSAPRWRHTASHTPSLAWNVAGEAHDEGAVFELTEAGDRGRDGVVYEDDERGHVDHVMRRRQQRWAASLAAAKASSHMAVTRPRTPPMEKRRLAEEAKRRIRDKAQRIALEESAVRQKEENRRRFERFVEATRRSGRDFRETNASRKKAEETRKKIEQDLQDKENRRLALEAELVRQREVSRAVRAYVDTSEARRREEHGAGPSLDELIKRKKEEKEAEFRLRRRVNSEGLRQALRKRPNLLERQEKHAQLHSKKAAAQATSARAFLESKDGFAAAGRRVTTGGGDAERWQTKALADPSFTATDKQQLGLAIDGSDSTSAAQSSWPYSSGGEDNAVREAGEGGGIASTAVDGACASSLSSASHPAAGGTSSEAGTRKNQEVATSEPYGKPQEEDPHALSKIKLEDRPNLISSENDCGTRTNPSNIDGGEEESLPTVVALEPGDSDTSDVGPGILHGNDVAEQALGRHDGKLDAISAR